MSKLCIYGLNENALDWFASYLNIRNQKCIVNGHLSDSCSLTCGILQGTLPCPLLFLIYINDLANCLNNSVPRMYADNTHLTYADTDSDMQSIQDSLNSDLLNISMLLAAD